MRRNMLLSLLLLLLLALPFGGHAVVVQPKCSQEVSVTLKERLKNLGGVVSVERLQSNLFNEKYVVVVRQLLDHQDSSAGFFQQRFVVGHISNDAPVVMITEGYAGDYALTPHYRDEISHRFNTNMVFVEHRFFSKSTPKPRDWKYLTAINSAHDLHCINQLMRGVYSDNKWISTGISKGGQTTILYKTYFPDDVDIAVPYVAPVCFGVEDGRHEPFIDRCGEAADRKRMRDFQVEVLSRRDRMVVLLDTMSRRANQRYKISLDEVLDYMVLEYPFSMWQWGTSTTVIPDLKSDDNTLFAHLMKIADASYFAINSEPSFFVQAAKELGYYGYDTRPFKGLLSIKTAKGYLPRVFLPVDAQELKFDKTLNKDIYAYLQKNDPKMVFIYGQYDPWTAAGVQDKVFVGKKNMIKAVEPNGSHRARIGTMPSAVQQTIWQTIEGWLND